MAKTDIVQYSLRLNLSNPDHLAVHKILKDLNHDIYKSQTVFMIKAILNYVNAGSAEKMQDEAKSDAWESAFFEKMEKSVTDKVMREMIAFLCSVMAGRGAVQTVMQVPQKEAARMMEAAEGADPPEEQFDETLADLVDQWS